MRSRRLLLPGAVATTLAVALGIMGRHGQAQARDSKPRPPFVQPPHDQMEQQFAAARARREQFVKDFTAQGRDPRSLPLVSIHSHNPGPASLQEAAAAADAIVVGRVQGTTFAPNPSGGPVPLATATVQVEQVTKGSAPSPLTVLQLGGPVPQASGGVLAQLDNDVLVLPGDEVALFLTYDAQRQLFRALPAAGVYFLKNGRALPERRNQFGQVLAGKSKAELIAAITAALGRP